MPQVRRRTGPPRCLSCPGASHQPRLRNPQIQKESPRAGSPAARGPEVSNLAKVALPNYTTVPNYILDTIMPDLSSSELRVLLVIIRLTLGWHVRSCQLSRSQLSEAAGCSETSCREATSRLEALDLVKVHRSDTGNHYEINMAWPEPPLDPMADPPQKLRGSNIDPLPPSKIEGSHYISGKKGEKEKDPPLPPLQQPDPEARIDRWVYETASGAGKPIKRFSGKERDHLIASDSPELREAISGDIDLHDADRLPGIILAEAGFSRGQRPRFERRGPVIQRFERTTPQKPPPEPCPSRDAMVAWLAEQEIPTKLNGVPCWKWDEVNVFRLTYPTYFEDEVYAEEVYERIKNDDHDGTIVLGMLYEIVKEPGRRKRAAEYEREV